MYIHIYSMYNIDRANSNKRICALIAQYIFLLNLHTFPTFMRHLSLFVYLRLVFVLFSDMLVYCRLTFYLETFGVYLTSCDL